MTDELNFPELTTVSDTVDVLREGRNGDRPARPPAIVNDSNVDYAEEMIKDSIDKVTDTLNTAVDLASSAEDPKMFAAVARLLDSITHAADRLARLRDQGLGNRGKDVSHMTPQPNISAPGAHIQLGAEKAAVFIGSPAELHQMLEHRRNDG